MSRKWILFILIVFHLIALNMVWAKPFTRLLDLNMEEVPGATLYELEFKRVDPSIEKEKRTVFKSKLPSWKGRLKPGRYQLRLRSYDARHVPGDWNKSEEIFIQREDLVISHPKDQFSFESSNEDQEKIDFSWNSVDGIKKYLFKLKSEDEKTKIEEILNEPQFSTKLPVGKKYFWSAVALDENSQPTESTAAASFVIWGTELKPPEIEKPKNEFVRALNWTAENEEHTSDFNVVLEKEADLNGAKWKAFKSIKNFNKNSFKFPANWPGGQYRLLVSSNGSYRKSSPPAELIFKVHSGSRTVKDEVQNMFRQSILGLDGWYGIASYLISKVSYSSQNFDSASNVSFTNFGGTGRLGLGFTSENSPFGFIGIADMSGFIYNGKNHTFFSIEADGTYRIPYGRSEFRLQMGISIKDLPDLALDPVTSEIREGHVTQMGPHFGTEIWYSLTPKLGIQLNGHFIYSLIKITTPNGAALVPTISDQLGFLASYRLTQKFTGLVGYVLRHDRSAYRSNPSIAGSQAQEGEVNQSFLSGTYLNFFAEWKL